MTNKTLFWSFFANFCALYASLRLKRTVFTQLLKKAIKMALWTKAITCDKAGFKSRFCQEHQAGKNIISVNPVILSNFSSCLLYLFVAKIPRNPRLIKDLRSTKAYVRKNKLFMQNKANFRKSQMIVTNVLTKDYEKKTLGGVGKTKPIQSQLKPIQSQSKPIQTQLKPKQSQNKPKQSQTNPMLARHSVWRACPPSVWRIKSKKMCLDVSKILTITNMDANVKKCTVFHLFIERTLFGR